MKEKLNNYFKNLSKSDKIGHSFLIGNVMFDDYKNDLKKVLSKYFFEEDIDIENNPDIVIIKPDNNMIKKEQIFSLQEQMHSTSQNNSIKVYIIDECEKFHPSAGNALLKNLEEPEKGIYAFLFSKNISGVLSTIKSRCQILFLESNIKDSFANYDKDDIFINKVVDYVLLVEKEGTEAIAFNKIYAEFTKDREKLNKFVTFIEYFYKDCLNVKCNINIEYFKKDRIIIEKISNKNTIKILNNKLMIINDLLIKLNYNLHIKLFIDELTIKLGGVGND